MEIDLASLNNEITKTFRSGVVPDHEIDENTLPPISRLKPLEDLARVYSNENESLTKELKELKETHAAEINKWKEYDNRIQAWKQQVYEIFQNLKKEAADKQTLAAELIKCRSALKNREREVELLRFYIVKKEGKDALEKLA